MHVGFLHLLLITLFSFTALASQKTLNSLDQTLLERGEISTAKYLAGGVVGTLVGFGSGHGIQGRYRDSGAKFLALDAAVLGGLIVGSIAACGLQGNNSGSIICRNTQAAAAGIFVGIRIWESYDLWVTPPKENKRYRELIEDRSPTSLSIKPYLIPTTSNAVIAGFGIEF